MQKTTVKQPSLKQRVAAKMNTTKAQTKRHSSSKENPTNDRAKDAKKLHQRKLSLAESKDKVEFKVI